MCIQAIYRDWVWEACLHSTYGGHCLYLRMVMVYEISPGLGLESWL